MKKTLFTALLFSCLTVAANAQNTQAAEVKIVLKNTSLLPKRVTIISYQPGDAGNGTEQVTMLPKATKEVTYGEGTKVYIANAKQVDVVMSGKRIDQEKPFLTVRKEDAGKTFTF